jgi:hypothetical protein
MTLQEAIDLSQRLDEITDAQAAEVLHVLDSLAEQDDHDAPPKTVEEENAVLRRENAFLRRCLDDERRVRRLTDREKLAEHRAAFRPLSSLVGGPVKTPKAAKCALKANPWIRWYRLRSNRRMVHLGDWIRYLLQRDIDPFENLGQETIIAFVAGANERYQEIHRRKAGG